MDNMYVEVVEIATDAVVKRLGPMSEAKADRVERGMLINMDHERFVTRQIKKGGH